MRQFILHSYDKSKSFNLNTLSALAVEPTGLGNNFNLSYKESDKGKHLTNVTPSFEPITLKIYFNADGTNGYGNYKVLMSFLAERGTKEFLFEYKDGVTDKYADVVFKSNTKSEINEEGLFIETFTFERQSYWYERIEETFSTKFTNPESTKFPLKFPFGFIGQVFSNMHSISNSFHIAAPLHITITGDIAKNEPSRGIRFFIGEPQRTTENGIEQMTVKNIIAELYLNTNCVEGKKIIIDPTAKKITIEQDGIISNGYHLTDKTLQSFLYLPQGNYCLGVNMKDTDTGEIKFALKRYLLD